MRTLIMFLVTSSFIASVSGARAQLVIQPEQPQSQPVAGGTAIGVQDTSSPAVSASMRPPPGQLYDDGSGQALFYEPLETERLTLKQNTGGSFSAALSAYFAIHSFFGPVSGTLPEFGARIGVSAISGRLGFIPDASLMSVGIEFLRFYGIKIADITPSMRLMLLGPGPALSAWTDFSRNVFMSLHATGLGIGFSTCGSLPIFVQARIPNLAVYVPFEVDDVGIDEGEHAVFFSWGFGLEAGILFN